MGVRFVKCEMRNIWLTLAAVNLIMTSSASRHGKKDDTSEQLVNTTSCLVRISEPSVGRRSYKAASQRDPDLRRWKMAVGTDPR